MSTAGAQEYGLRLKNWRIKVIIVNLHSFQAIAPPIYPEAGYNRCALLHLTSPSVIMAVQGVFLSHALHGSLLHRT
jgi:hypothetical protein